MRKFQEKLNQAKNDPRLAVRVAEAEDALRIAEAGAEDVLGTYGHVDSETLQERITFVAQYMAEKAIEKHFPGPHFRALGMDLTDEFKKELSAKAKAFYKKRHEVGEIGELVWMCAKKLPMDTITDTKIPISIREIIQYTKIFKRKR